VTLHQYIHISFIMDLDIIPYQTMKKRACGVVQRIDSWDLQDNNFFVENKTRFVFYSGVFAFPMDLRPWFSRHQIVRPLFFARMTPSKRPKPGMTVYDNRPDSQSTSPNTTDSLVQRREERRLLLWAV
jgi:hypothetical protein